MFVRFKGVNIIQSCGQVMITTDVGLTVGFNGVYNVFVEVTGQYRGKVFGLCGNFNGQQNDDFTTKDTRITDDATLFGNSWKVENSC